MQTQSFFDTKMRNMATDKSFIDFVLEQLRGLDGITCRRMMGEYIIYHHSKIAACVCDNRLLVKPVEAAFSMMPSAHLEPPYAGAKDMLLVDDLDDKRFLIELFEAMYPELPEPKPKKTKR